MKATLHSNAAGSYFNTVLLSLKSVSVVERRFVGSDSPKYLVTTKSSAKAWYSELHRAYEHAIDLQAWIDAN